MNSTEFELPGELTLGNQVKKTRKTTKSVSISYRLMVLYRFLLAGIGGYLLASLSAIVIAQTFSTYQSSAAMSATLVAFCLQCAAFIWVFMVHKTRKATLGIVLPSLALFLIYKIMGN